MTRFYRLCAIGSKKAVEHFNWKFPTLRRILTSYFGIQAWKV